ncbi:hypothetical protein Vadar_020021 [Vaccinium darrowii]|uniref:Uncharacterized protein n=1 Tax=Vaccinium darrowii TaxID=229202 RepID=A0ACB7ZCR9_9ERIC|nr:hypothetical protein Vadar_020021 [Vaccinium darrowii]
MGGTQRQVWELTDFQQFVQDSNLIDLGYVGYPFTWNNKRPGRDNVRVRLDHCFASSSWRIRYPNAVVNHLQPGGSDHVPILLDSLACVEKFKHRFIFDKRWGGNATCGSIIQQAWGKCIQGSKWFQIHQKIKACRFGLIQWRKHNQCNSRFNKDHLESKIQQLFECSSFDQQEFWHTENLLKKALIDEEDYWRNKARVNWLKSGDRNTAFFHAQTIQRRQQNRLMGLEDASGRWWDGEQAVKGIALDYFQHIFSTEGVTNVDTVLQCVDHRVSDGMNHFLTRAISFNEVKVAVFQMPSDKAPGPDGMGAGFFQEYSDVVGPSLVDAVRSYCHSGHLLRSINHTHIVLIPKVQCPMNMGQLRPISLCNSVYKVLSKVFVNRLRRFLPQIVGESQCAFVSGRLISDNTILAQEALHFMKNCRAKRDEVCAIAAILDDYRRASDESPRRLQEIRYMELEAPAWRAISSINICTMMRMPSLLKRAWINVNQQMQSDSFVRYAGFSSGICTGVVICEWPKIWLHDLLCLRPDRVVTQLG